MAKKRVKKTAKKKVTKPEPETSLFIPTPDLLKRAKSLGFTEEQITTYTDDAALKAACDRIKPQATPQPEPKPKPRVSQLKIAPDKPKGKPARATCISKISVLRAAYVIRAGYDQSNMEVFCRQYKPKILSESIQKVTVIRDYVPNKRDILTSIIIIDYLK